MNNFELIRTNGPDDDAVSRPVNHQTVIDGESPSLVMQYLDLLRRYKWMIIGGAVVGAFLAILATLFMTPVYTATTTIEIQREQGNFTMVQGTEPESASVDFEFYETQYGLLRARSLAEEVARDLKLAGSAEFFELYGVSDAAEWFDGERLSPSAPSEADRLNAAADVLLENLSVNPVRLSRLAMISFTAPDPQLAKRVVDSWAENFIESTLDRKFEASSYARSFLEERLEQLRERIDTSERRAVDYAASQGIVTLPQSTGGDGSGQTVERPIVVDDLATLNAELTRAKADRIEAESRLGAEGGATTEGLQNNAIGQLRARRAELSAEYSKLLQRFEPAYPPAQALRSQIDELDRSITREERRVRDTLRSTYEASLQRERALAAQVSGLKGDLLDSRRRSIEYNIAQRDVDTNRQLYDALLQRYKEIGVAGGVGVNNIAVIDVAELPTKPSRPRPLLNVLVGLLAGLGLGLVGALLREHMDDGLKDPTEVPRSLLLPLLGTVPEVEGEPIDQIHDKKSAISEAYFSLQTNLALSTEHGVPRTLAVTSSRPAEGKTTTSVALAEALSRVGKKVLLIDADMRSPSINSIYNLDNDKGLSTILAGQGAAQDQITALTDNLSVLLTGQRPPNPAELLSGEALANTLEELLTRFDHIVIDSPPVMGFADAPLIADAAQATVLTIKFNDTQVGVARVAIQRLRGAKANILGAIVTRFDAGKASSSYGYNYGYGYGYGEDDAAA